MSFLAAEAIKPEARVLAPNIHAHPEEALAYWLSNPLLPAGRVAATKQLMESRHYTKGDKQALVRLKKHVEVARQSMDNDSRSQKLLTALLRNELVEPAERNDHKPYLAKLRGEEIEWEYARLEAAIKQREYDANPHADAA